MGASKLQLQKAKYAKKLVNYPWHAFALSGVKVLHQNHLYHNILDFEFKIKNSRLCSLLHGQ